MPTYIYIYTEFASCLIYPFILLIGIGVVLQISPKESIFLHIGKSRPNLNSFQLKIVQFTFQNNIDGFSFLSGPERMA